jgi:hypothetical protein
MTTREDIVAPIWAAWVWQPEQRRPLRIRPDELALVKHPSIDGWPEDLVLFGYAIEIDATATDSLTDRVAEAFGRRFPTPVPGEA